MNVINEKSGTKNTRKSAGIKLRCLQIRLYSSVFSDCYGAMSHTARCSEGSQGSGDDAGDDLQNGFPGFLFHFSFLLLPFTFLLFSLFFFLAKQAQGLLFA